jgi:hypothetical protein
MKKHLLKYAIALAALLSIAVFPVFAETDNWTGVVADNLCINRGIAADGTDMTTSPENHTTKCALAQPCVESGYALLVKNDYGGYDSFPFDKKGNKLAFKYFQSTDKTDNHVVKVTGKLMSDNTIKVKHIAEAM